MAEMGFVLELVRRQLSFIRTYQEQKNYERLRLKIVGCLVVLMAGCSTITPHQEASMGSSASKAQPNLMSADTKPQSPPIRTPKWELAIPDQPSVDTWVRRFSEEKHKSFQVQLERARHYAVPAQRIFQKQGLPKDLIYVALVESGFCPTARSHANAVGMWQFIATTGKRFGLEQNRWIDERRHPLKAARAAAEYLSFLYDTFGSWPLALAAYNAGENAVQGALDQSGLKTFWELAETGYLPVETRDYVPKVLATVKIIRNAHRYGFYFDPEHYVPRNETVAIPGGVKLSWIGKKIGVPEDLLEDCNPELCRPVTPPVYPLYELNVPIGKAEAVLSALAEPPVQEEKHVRKGSPALSRSPHTLYKVKHGDTWFSLARKYKCSPKTLAALNGMKPSQLLKAGETIKTYAEESSFVVASARKKERKEKASSNPRAKSNSRTEQKSHRTFYYSICPGDTLWSIAERFHTSVEILCAHNKLKPGQKLIPGNQLMIRASEPDTARVMKRRS